MNNSYISFVPILTQNYFAVMPSLILNARVYPIMHNTHRSIMTEMNSRALPTHVCLDPSLPPLPRSANVNIKTPPHLQ
jgi:hypothetical protein